MVWLLFIAALVFAYLAFDAWRMAPASKGTLNKVPPEHLGDNTAGVMLQEQNERRIWHPAYRLGEGSLAVWGWACLALACAIGAATKLAE